MPAAVGAALRPRQGAADAALIAVVPNPSRCRIAARLLLWPIVAQKVSF